MSNNITKLLRATFLIVIFFNVTTNASQLTPQQITKVLKESYEKFKDDNRGKNADYIKALAEVNSSIFAISIVSASGDIYEIGNTKEVVSIQSISKVFTLALVMSEKGPKFIQEKIGVNATGLPFNSIIAIEQHNGSASNPFVNAGAIQTTSWVKADNSAQRWKKIKNNMEKFAGEKLDLNAPVYKSEVNDNKRNQAIATLLEANGRMGSDPLKATTIYTKQCALNVSSHNLAIMASVLANHGVNPVTKKSVIDSNLTPKIMSIMQTAGLYDNAGEWLYETGLPAKSGVGGGILAVVPGKFGIGVISPRLDEYGNSVRAQEAISYIVKKLNLNPLAQ
ncbi:MAG: glutaminase A [Helicobacteraceae bacterium]|nr:glutaminase A [Helicobacteraceae bacterium]